MKTNYPLIHKLGIIIRLESNVNHIISDDLNKVLTKEQLNTFEKYFGIQTCLLRNDGKSGMYVWDVEAVLQRMFNNKLIGSQLNWD